MQTLNTIIAIAISGVILGGCALVDRGRIAAAKGAGYAVVVECALADAERKKNLQAVNAWLAGEQHPHRAVALDCDGDGASDF